MEEMIGRWWHQAITLVASQGHPQAMVQLKEVEKTIGILFRAGGGASALRLAPASGLTVGGQRNWLQKVAGSGIRTDTAQLEPDVLALPATLSVFDQAHLNRDLYLWLALVSACFDNTGDWLADNQRATERALQRFPGFKFRYQTLLQTHLAQRPDPHSLSGAAAQIEHTIRLALTGQPTEGSTITPQDAGAVWLWLSASPTGPVNASQPDTTGDPADSRAHSVEDKKRRRTQQTQHESNRHAMVLPFRGEALMSWSEMVQVNRSTDDEDDGNALDAANDMEKLSVAPHGQTLASRVKFDLDLPSASADDLPLGSGLSLPEWNYKKGVLQPDHCRVQVMQTQSPTPFVPAPALKLTARRVRRKLETLRDAPRPMHGQDSGDDIDLDAWVRFNADQHGHAGWHSDTPPVYTRRIKSERSLATLLLADLSLSTDAYATPHAKVIDVIRDALFVFGEALHAVDDPFAVWGFSSVRRQHVRLQHLKPFDEPWDDACRARVGAIRPGYYTRMGAAVRHATLQLAARPERRRLLMLLTDGKPNDLDVYEGRYGLEDTRHAVQAARAAGLSPFCITIDETAHDYLPMLFGQQGYAMVRRPQDLVKQLTQAWATLSRR
jgi:nitric oxide reductase NorD protein